MEPIDEKDRQSSIKKWFVTVDGRTVEVVVPQKSEQDIKVYQETYY